MNIRRFPAAAGALATLMMWLHSATLVAQETSPPNAVPGSSVAPVEEPVQLAGGASDVLKLSRAKVNDDVTVAFIQNSDGRYNLTAAEIVYLRKAGVSDRVLTTMLHQQPQFAPASEPTAPASAPTLSAPQSSAPATTTVAETSPASTFYEAPSAPTYYSFYDPSPYWYEPWPYWYTSSYSWGYPFFTFGFYWGGCNYGYWHHGYGYNSYWNNCWHDGNHQSPPLHGNHPTPNGNSPPRDGRSGPSGKIGIQASKRSPSGGVDQLRSPTGPPARTTQSTAQTRLSTDNRNQPAASKANANQIKGPRSGQGASPTRIGGGDANNQTAARGLIGTKGVTQFARNSQPVAPRSTPSPTSEASPRKGQVAGPTRVWTGGAGQGPTTRSVVSRNAPSIAGPSRASTSPTMVGNRSAVPPTSPAAVKPAATYQRSSFNPSYASRGSGSIASIGRPAMSSSSVGMGNAGAFRGGGGFAGASAPRVSSGAGGFRGGGGGGFASGGFSHGGGGGGGRHR